MSTIDVPVRMIIDTQDVGEFLAGVLQQDGTLRVTVCPWCFALVPNQKLPDHIEALKH
jgi:hypothetical protein